MQDCLLGDLVAFDRMLEEMKRRPLYGKKKQDPDFEFMFALRAGSKQGMIEALQANLKRHRYRNIFAVQKDYISHPVLGFLKLAWIRGFEIEIDHPLVPMEWMPVRPNRSYTDPYPFLKEFG